MKKRMLMLALIGAMVLATTACSSSKETETVETTTESTKESEDAATDAPETTETTAPETPEEVIVGTWSYELMAPDAAEEAYGDLGVKAGDTLESGLEFAADGTGKFYLTDTTSNVTVNEGEMNGWSYSEENKTVTMSYVQGDQTVEKTYTYDADNTSLTDQDGYDIIYYKTAK